MTNRFFGTILLIVGTAVGAGMLALPVSTAAYGFFPSIFLFILCWSALTFTALLILEINLWVQPGANLISMAKQTLGPWGQVVAWITYTLLLFSLMAAYLSGLTDLIQTLVNNFFHHHLYDGTGALLLIILVGTMVYMGTTHVDYLNRVFFTGKLLTYIALVILVSPHIQIPNLSQVHLNKIWLAMPIVVTSFGFHNVIPSLRVYMESDVKKLRIAILTGSLIPLIIYLIWQFVIVGTVPMQGKEGLIAVFASGQPGTGLAAALNHILQNTWVSPLFKAFVFFAMTTSFIGVSFSLYDFLIDGLQIKRTHSGRLLASFITFLPPFLFALYYPQGFILALSYAGIFVAILFGILPVLMAWKGRYRKQIAAEYRVSGGKTALVLIILFSLILILAQLADKLF